MITNTQKVEYKNRSLGSLQVNNETDLEFIEKVNVGLQESMLGLVNTKQEAEQKLSKWL